MYGPKFHSVEGAIAQYMNSKYEMHYNVENVYKNTYLCQELYQASPATKNILLFLNTR